MIEVRSVLFINPADEDFNPQVENNALVIDGVLAAECHETHWYFRTVTSWEGELPVVDLSTCRRFELTTKVNPSKLDWAELMRMPFTEAILKLSWEGTIID